MKAMIFAAGLGTRLKPITDNCPKALVDVGGKPMLRRVIENMRAIGIAEMVVKVHHHADMIIDYLTANDNFGVNIHVSDERQRLLDTGGAILKARRWLDGDEPFIVHNADILTDLDLAAMSREHISSGADVTLLVASRATKRYFLFDERSCLRGWLNKTTGETMPAGIVNDGALRELAFGGIHILSPGIFDRLEAYAPDEKFSIVPFYVASCSDLKIKGYVSPAEYKWIDIGKPETLAQARDAVKDM